MEEDCEPVFQRQTPKSRLAILEPEEINSDEDMSDQETQTKLSDEDMMDESF